MSDHLGYDKHDVMGRNGENSRNGYTSKTVTTEVGPVTIDVPRDREGSFTPQIVPKRQRRLAGFDESVLSLYAKGMTTGVRSGTVANRPVYVAMGVNMKGQRDVLGLWVGPTGGEGAKQWLTILTDLKNRGILDVCIVCCDGLKGLPAAVNTIWLLAIVQTCVVHLVRACGAMR
jgi:transposase-like protein